MHVPCNLREIRGKRTLQQIADAAGIHKAALSQFERGRLIPSDEQIARLEVAYGAERTTWWPPAVLLALETDPPKDDHS